MDSCQPTSRIQCLTPNGLFRESLVHALRCRGNHCSLSVGERPSFVGESWDRGLVAVGGDKGIECVNEVPRGTIDPGFFAGVDIVHWTQSPAFAARNQFEFHNALSAELDGDAAIKILRRTGNEDAVRFLQCGNHFWTAHDLREMRRPDLFFAFGDQNEVDGKFLSGATDGVQRSQECRFRALLVDGAAPDHDFAESGLVDECSVERRRRPFGGRDLFHVVHEIDTEGAGSASVEGGENSRLAVGGNFCGCLKSGVAQHLHGQFATLVHSAIFCGNRGLTNPSLQALHGLVVTFFDLFPNRLKIGLG